MLILVTAEEAQGYGIDEIDRRPLTKIEIDGEVYFKLSELQTSVGLTPDSPKNCDEWTPHPTSPGFFFKGDEVIIEAELTARRAAELKSMKARYAARQRWDKARQPG